MERWIQDARYSARVLRASPVFTLTVLLTLTLAIAANAVVFAVVHAALLRPLPFHDERRLVVAAPLAPGVVLDWRLQARSLISIAAFLTWDMDVTGNDRPERVPAAVVTTDFFQTLGVTAVSGRTFAADDTGGRAVAIVSHGYVQRHFGTDTTALGRSLWINGRQHVIIGVMAADVRFPTTVDLWLPPRHVIPEYPLDPSADPTRNRGSHYLGVVARLHQGATRESAQLEQRAIFHRLIAQYPKEMVAEDANVQLLPVRDWLTGDLSSGLLILLCAVAVVLLLACANVANLMFARASARAHELAVRTALGASAAAITRQVVTESVMLAAAGGTMGLLASRWVLPTLIAFSPSDV